MSPLFSNEVLKLELKTVSPPLKMNNLMRIDTKIGSDKETEQMNKTLKTQRYRVKVPEFEYYDPSVVFTKALAKQKTKNQQKVIV